MRTKFLALVALLFGMASCQNDPEIVNPTVGDEVDFQLAVGVPELNTRAAENGTNDTLNNANSAYGAIDYLQGVERGDDYRTDWSDVDIRYSLEVYDKADSYTDAVPVKDRQVIIVDEYEPVAFNLRLVPDREYHFVVFADFVPNGSKVEEVGKTLTEHHRELGLHHTIDGNLGKITIKADGINDECTDAYFATKDITISNSAAQDIELKRPYGKVRVIATDLNQLNINVDPAAVVVTYDEYHPNAFNAVTGKIDGKYEPKEYVSVYNDGVCKLVDDTHTGLANHFYTAGYDNYNPYGTVNENGVERHTHMTLFTDYILANEQQSPIHFTMDVYQTAMKNGEEYEFSNLIKSTDFNTEIPIQRNFLTTIVGNVLTTATEIKVTIDDNFANNEGETQEHKILATLITGGKYVLTRDLVINTPTTMNDNVEAIIDLNGYELRYEGNDIMSRIGNGSKLIIKGDKDGSSLVSTDYIASANANGEIHIYSGDYTAATTCFNANGGKVYIYGGSFQVTPSEYGSTYLLNHVDAEKDNGLIEVSGGVFYDYNPEESYSENPAMNFVKDGYSTIYDDTNNSYSVVAAIDYEVDENSKTVYAYSADGLLKWSWLVANDSPTWSVKVMRDITMPMNTVEEDAANKTFKYTTTDITIGADGKPSGSNWKQVGTYQPLNKYIDAVVDGNNKTISNLTMYSENLITGFVGYSDNIEVKNLTFNNATIYSTNSYVSPISYAEDGSYIHNVHVKNSFIRGASYVAGIAAEAMDHYDDEENHPYVTEFMTGTRQKLMPLVTLENCTTDANTSILGTSTTVGGIVGQGYGCMIINCHNKANVTGAGYTGGVAGYLRDYFHNQYGYIVNCSSTDCTIKSSGARTGGIVGYLMEGHNGHAWIVGCYSNSIIECTKSNTGSLVGQVNGTNKVLGCYAVSTLGTVGNSNNSNNYPYSFSFADAASVTAEAVEKMNEGIAEYNAFAAGYTFPAAPVSARPMVLPQLNKSWTWTNGNYPVLQ